MLDDECCFQHRCPVESLEGDHNDGTLEVDVRS